MIFHPMMRTGSSATALFLYEIGGERVGRHHDLMKKKRPSDLIFSAVRNHFDFLVTVWHKLNEKTKIDFQKWLHIFVGSTICSAKYQPPTGYRNTTIGVTGTHLYNNQTIQSADRILKYETLNEDLSNLLEMEVSIPVHHVTALKEDYRSYYNQEDIDLVNKHYGLEMKKYGYTFDNGVKREDILN